MKISGSAVLHATPEKVWAAITDPTVLAGVIPGCQTLTDLGDMRFALGIVLGVASIKGNYTGEVSLYDMVEPTSLTMKAAGAGGPGTIEATVGVTLADNNDGTTTLTYDADAVVGGMVGGVGQRVLTSVAKKTAGQFFSAIDEVLTGARVLKEVTTTSAAATGSAPAAAAAAPATAGAPTFAAPVAAATGGARTWELLGAAVFGALAVLAGVLVGRRR